MATRWRWPPDNDVGMALVEGQAVGVIEARQPLAQQFHLVVRLQRQMALGDGELQLRIGLADDVARGDQLVLDAAIDAVQLAPRRGVVLGVAPALEDGGFGVFRLLVHHVQRHHVDLVAGGGDEIGRPPDVRVALHVAPADQQDIGVAGAHGVGECAVVLGVLGRGEALAGLRVGRLVADLPGLDLPRLGAAVGAALGVVGVVAVADEVGGPLGSAGALLAARGVDVLGPTVAG
jgi:hypothetical protein